MKIKFVLFVSLFYSCSLQFNVPYGYTKKKFSKIDFLTFDYPIPLINDSNIRTRKKLKFKRKSHKINKSKLSISIHAKTMKKNHAKENQLIKIINNKFSKYHIFRKQKKFKNKENQVKNLNRKRQKVVNTQNGKLLRFRDFLKKFIFSKKKIKLKKKRKLKKKSKFNSLKKYQITNNKCNRIKKKRENNLRKPLKKKKF